MSSDARGASRRRGLTLTHSQKLSKNTKRFANWMDRWDAIVEAQERLLEEAAALDSAREADGVTMDEVQAAYSAAR
jgi:hypothetical protein